MRRRGGVDELLDTRAVRDPTTPRGIPLLIVRSPRPSRIEILPDLADEVGVNASASSLGYRVAEAHGGLQRDIAGMNLQRRKKSQPSHVRLAAAWSA